MQIGLPHFQVTYSMMLEYAPMPEKDKFRPPTTGFFMQSGDEMKMYCAYFHARSRAFMLGILSTRMEKVKRRMVNVSGLLADMLRRSSPSPLMLRNLKEGQLGIWRSTKEEKAKFAFASFGCITQSRLELHLSNAQILVDSNLSITKMSS